MVLSVANWGEVDGAPVRLFTLSNSRGMVARVSDFGATLQSLVLPDRKGEPADIVLGFDRPEAYPVAGTYFGATVGRYGNRIRRGRFTLGGKDYALACNEGENHLHGGDHSYDKRLWSATPADDGTSVAFGLVSPDGDEGYPGTLVAESRYALNDANELTIEITASVSAPSPVNFVHHSYFNLAGTGSIVDQEISIAADHFTPVDAALMPTGEIAAVRGTPFDFTAMKRIGADIDVVENAGAGRLDGGSGGFDHNWVLRGEGGRLRDVVTARDPASGRGFVLATTEPGVHFYTGGYLGGIRGKGGVTYPRFAGFTLETQKFPDSPNIPHFPSATVLPGSLYHHVMQFRFFD